VFSTFAGETHAMKYEQHPLSAAFPAIEELIHGWSGMTSVKCRPIFACEMFQSARHPGFLHYGFYSLRDSTSWFSKHPVKPEFLIWCVDSHLVDFGLRVSDITWHRTDAKPNDREVVVAPAKNEWVYFLRAGPFLKIGYATDIGKRIRELQTGCPYPISLVASIQGDRTAEGCLHRQFKSLRVNGEWFRFSGALVEYVAQVAERIEA